MIFRKVLINLMMQRFEKTSSVLVLILLKMNIAVFLVLIRVGERSSDSYIGRDDFFRFFFPGNIWKLVQAQFSCFVV